MGNQPPWYKGQMFNCDICGFWYGDREGKFREQRGLKHVCPKCYDSLTDEQRQEQLSNNLR